METCPEGFIIDENYFYNGTFIIWVNRMCLEPPVENCSLAVNESCKDCEGQSYRYYDGYNGSYPDYDEDMLEMRQLPAIFCPLDDELPYCNSEVVDTCEIYIDKGCGIMCG